MPCCLAGCLALITPRLLILAMAFFTDYLSRAYETMLWPVLGFIFMPVTTLAYAFAINQHGKLDGIYLAIFIIAVLIDVGAIGGGGWSGKRKARRRAEAE